MSEGASPHLPTPAVEGPNDFGRIGWGGPCPPAGTPHDYVFTLYALPAPLALPEDVSAEAVTSAAGSAALATAGYRGTYGR